VVRRIRRGYGRPEDLDTLLRIARFASQGMTICPLGDAFCEPIRSFVTRFRNEFEEAISRGKPLPVKKQPTLPVRSGRGVFGV
jgi:NADH-quinone oxidoreductase subunit F